MTHYTVRDGDTVTVYSTSVEGIIFEGDIEEWAAWKIERDQPTEGITAIIDGEEVEMDGNEGPYADAEPQEVIKDYEENDWFESDTNRVPVFCL